MIMRSKGYKRSNVKCGSCVGHCMCEEPGDSPLSCPDRLVPGQTNADRIRAMSDEELAELIVKHHPMYAWNKQVRKIYFGFDDHRKDNPQRAWLEWLKQPAE